MSVFFMGARGDFSKGWGQTRVTSKRGGAMLDMLWYETNKRRKSSQHEGDGR